MQQLTPQERQELGRTGYEALLDKYGEEGVKRILQKAGEASFRKQAREAVARGEYPNQKGYW
jgi:hypothetical protein